MKNFIFLFKSSASELKDIRVLVTTGMLVALSIVLEMFTIKITPDIWISFSFLAVAVIGYLYGPVVCGLANIAVDFVGYLWGGGAARLYSPLLGLVVVLAGIIYGVVLYKKQIKVGNCILAKATVNLICNFILNSIIIYTSFVVKSFDIFSSEQVYGFLIWISPRLLKNIAMLPLEIFLLFIILKTVQMAKLRMKKA